MLSTLFQRLLFAASFIFSLVFSVLATAFIDVPADSSHAWRALKAAHTLLLSISRGHDDTFLVVGSRGHILTNNSQDTWVQQASPVQVMLTSIDAGHATGAWAVGHDAVILRQAGSQSWQLMHQDIEEQRPLLDVLSVDGRVIAIGAYGYYLQSDNGGQDWQDRLINEEHDFHLNAISARNNQEFFIAAEAGQLYRSMNAGKDWQTLDSPYEGSFFDVLAMNESTVIAVGLRGHVFISGDDGESWQPISTDVQTSLNSIVKVNENHVLVVGHAGMILWVDIESMKVSRYQLSSREDLSDIVMIDDTSIYTVGEHGVLRHDLCRMFSTDIPACPKQ